MSRHFIALDPAMVSHRLTRICDSLVGCLTAIFDLPFPLVIFIEGVASFEEADDTHISESELDVNVRAAITVAAPNTIWIVPSDEDSVVRAVAHEVGHIAELLGYVPERDDIEEFPQLLANAVATTYSTGLGWIDRLLGSNFYFRALAEGPSRPSFPAGWARAGYWRRLARTRGAYGYLGDTLPAADRSQLAAGWRAALAPAADSAQHRRAALFAVPRPDDIKRGSTGDVAGIEHDGADWGDAGRTQ